MKQMDCEGQAKSYIRKHFPDLKDVEPTHTTRRHGERRVHVFAFKGKSPVSGGVLYRIVRVFVDQDGKIVKAVSSK